MAGFVDVIEHVPINVLFLLVRMLLVEKRRLFRQILIMLVDYIICA